MPGVKIESFYLEKKIYDHVEEVAYLSRLTIRDTIECLLHEHMLRSSGQMQSSEETGDKDE